MKIKSLLIVGLVAIAASAMVSSVAQNALSGRVSPTTAPQFALQSETGRPVSLASTLGGRKAVLLNFWFAACAPCREEFPHLEKIYKRFKPQGLEIVALNATDESAVMQKFRREMKLSIPFASDPGHKISSAYGVVSTPTSILIDARGNIIWRSVGVDPEGLKSVLEEVLG